jgi:asparagine synthase (glutamine-hydrolysing)
MCGIIAIAGRTDKIEDRSVDKMLSCLDLRGPDEKAWKRLSGVVLGQTRLSIVDISGGHQPMKDNSRPHTIVFNGEIYGYKDLRADLEKKGHLFSTQSDTEVILKAYAEYGRECVKHIDGMFAFAIWDEEKQEMFLARDRFGKKPLYYAWDEDVFFAASEIKSIFAGSSLKGKVDPEALDLYLRLMYIPSFRTIYSNVSMLPPAYAGIVKDGKLETWRYWDLERNETTITYEAAKEKIKELFDEAVKKRMVADVEIGALLSGGVDSTLVTLYAQKYSSFPIKTFSVGYEGNRNELPYALEASKKIGTDHRTLEVNADLSNELSKIIEYMDEPHGDNSNFPQHLISKLAATKVKVALSGDGADELFMGYGWYQTKWHMPRWRLDWKLLDPWQANQKAIAIFTKRERKKLLQGLSFEKPEYEKSITRNIEDPIQKINAYDLKYYLPGQLLSKIDRTSMMHSLEMRSPFLDTKLAEFVYSLPTEWKITKTQNKVILKNILAETFPKEFVYRKKQGFGAPIAEWMKTDNMRKLIDETLADNPMYTFIYKKAVIKARDAFYANKRNSANKLWVLLCLGLWFKTHSIFHERTP